MYENDPDRLKQPRVGDPVRHPVIQRGAMPVFMTAALFAAAVIAFALYFWPSERAPSVTESSPRIERPTAPTPPAIPPANKPETPTTPAPPPAQ